MYNKGHYTTKLLYTGILKKILTIANILKKVRLVGFLNLPIIGTHRWNPKISEKNAIGIKNISITISVTGKIFSKS